MRIQLSIIFTSVLLTCNPGWAEPFKSMSFPIAEVNKEESTWQTGDGEDYKGLSRMVNVEKAIPLYSEKRIKTISLNGKDYYQIIEKEKLVNEQILESSYLIEIGEYLKLFSFDFVRKNPEGKIIRTGKIYYDDQSWNYQDDIYAIPMVSLVFRSLIEHDIKENTFHLWLDDMLVVPMKATVVGKEQIHVVLGDFHCHKVMMEVDIQRLPFGRIGKFITRLFKPWMPQFYFWFWENKPYPLLKLDTISPPGSPKNDVNIVEYTSFMPSIRWTRTDQVDNQVVE